MVVRTDSMKMAFLVLLLGILAFLVHGEAAAATDGTVEIEVTTVSFDGHYAPKNVGAIWVENAQGQFVKSVEVWAKKRAKHLTNWQAASGGNEVDAVTSATLRTHESHTANWDCTDLNGTVVPDGNYKVFIEFTEENSASSGKPPSKLTSIGFTKGSSDQTVNPPDEEFFKSMKLIYTAGSGGGGPAPGSLAGHVEDAVTHEAISGATVRLKIGNSIDYETTTNSAGDYAIADVQAADYLLACSCPGYNTVTSDLTVGDGQNLTGFDIALSPLADTTPPAPPRNVKVTVN